MTTGPPPFSAPLLSVYPRTQSQIIDHHKPSSAASALWARAIRIRDNYATVRYMRDYAVCSTTITRRPLHEPGLHSTPCLIPLMNSSGFDSPRRLHTPLIRSFAPVGRRDFFYLPVAEKWLGSAGPRALKIRGECGQLRMSSTNRTCSLMSRAPAGWTLPEWFEARPAQVPGQLGAPHFWRQIASDSTGSR
jgi:hypothetical protein